MGQEPETLDAEKIAAIDNWVARQFGLKNTALLEHQSGLHIIDRSPLDPLAFTPAHEWPKKAAFLKRHISPKRARRRLRPGHVVFLTGDADVLEARAVSRHKDFKPKGLGEQQRRLEAVFPQADGVTVIDTREKGISEVVRRVARIIHREAYTEDDLQRKLDAVEKGEIRGPDPTTRQA